MSPPSETNRSHNEITDEITDLMALPIQIKLKNPSQFPHPKQYPLKPEGQ
jgi:hypothetical protein